MTRTDYNAIDYGTAESSPDATVTPWWCSKPAVHRRRDHHRSPFQHRRQIPSALGTVFDEGTAAPFSVVNGSETFAFIGGGKSETPGVYALNGNTTQKISTDAIDELIAGPDHGGARCGVWLVLRTIRPHFFIGLDPPTHRHCIRYHYRDLGGSGHRATSTWNDDTIDITYRAPPALSRHTGISSGDTARIGRIGLLSMDTQHGVREAVHRVASTQPFQNNMQPYFVPHLELRQWNRGVGNEAEPDPTIIMDRSPNGGKVLPTSAQRPVGEGEYNRRAILAPAWRVSRFDVPVHPCPEPVSWSLSR